MEHNYEACVNKALVQSFKPVSLFSLLPSFSLEDSELVGHEHNEDEDDDINDHVTTEDEASRPKEFIESHIKFNMLITMHHPIHMWYTTDFVNNLKDIA